MVCELGCSDGDEAQLCSRRAAWPPGSVDAARAGKPLAAGWSAALVGIQGDLEFEAKYLRLEHFGSLSPCPWCKANKSTLPWTEFRRPGPQQACWWATVWDDRPTWEAAHPNRCKLLEVLEMSVCNVVPDWMHCKHLGCDAWTYGSVLHLLRHQLDVPIAEIDSTIKLHYEDCARERKSVGNQSPLQTEK